MHVVNNTLRSIVLPLLILVGSMLGGCAVSGAVGVGVGVPVSTKPDPAKLSHLGHPVVPDNERVEDDGEEPCETEEECLGLDTDIAAYIEATRHPSVRYFDLRQQARVKEMCAEQGEAYCAWPMVPHCHGTYCHAHPGGEHEHTHRGDREFAMK